MKYLVTLIVISIALITNVSAQEQTASSQNKKNEIQYGTLIVDVVEFRNSDGKLYASLFDSKKGFPGKPEKAVRKAVGTISNKTARIEFKGIPFGVYAVSVAHDENGNGKIDTNFLGIPKEGVGASNDAKGTLGPPKFKDAKFNLNKPNQTIKITMGYY